jgi:hypothetical protein
MIDRVARLMWGGKNTSQSFDRNRQRSVTLAGDDSGGASISQVGAPRLLMADGIVPGGMIA